MFYIEFRKIFKERNEEIYIILIPDKKLGYRFYWEKLRNRKFHNLNGPARIWSEHSGNINQFYIEGKLFNKKDWENFVTKYKLVDKKVPKF